MSFAVVATVATVVGTAYSAYSQIQAGKAAAAQADVEAQYQRQMADYNSRVQENNARSIRDQSAAKEDSQRRMVRIQQGKERASIAQSGLSASGSLLDVYDQNATYNELDLLNTRYSGEMDARGLAAQSALTSWSGNAEADFTKQRGKNANTASIPRSDPWAALRRRQGSARVRLTNRTQLWHSAIFNFSAAQVATVVMLSGSLSPDSAQHRPGN
jgi:hypothetical protein